MRKRILLLLCICILLSGCGSKEPQADLTDIGQAFPLLRMERDEVQKILGKEWNKFEGQEEEYLGAALLIAQGQYALKEIPIVALHLDFVYDSPKAMLRNVKYVFYYEDLEQAQEIWKWFAEGKKEIDDYLGKTEDFTENCTIELDHELNEADLKGKASYKAKWSLDEEDSLFWEAYGYAFSAYENTEAGEKAIVVTLSTTPPPYGYEE